MATAIKYGMKGDDVKNLQTNLNNSGYKLDVDGSFGPQTLAAVKDYQKKNNLTVDGMAGPQTMSALKGNISGNTVGSGSTASANTGINSPDKFSYDDFSYDDYDSSGAVEKATEKPFSYGEFSSDDFSYGDYQKSETVMQAEAALGAALAAQPGAYESTWQSQVNDIIGRIMNREKFSYDINEDELYQKYRAQYIRDGKMAMQDAMGQAASMTGGYGNSWVSTAGNQAYQGHLSKLNEVVPELYGLALDRHQMEGQELYNQFGMLSSQEQQDYARYLDEYNKWSAERDYTTGRYDTESDRDYSKYADDRNFAYGEYSDDRNFDYNAYSEDKSYAYNDYINTIENAKWQEDRDYNKYVNDRNFAYGEYADNKNYAYNDYLNEIERERYEQDREYQMGRDAVADSQWDKSFGYQKERDEVSDSQWETSRQDARDAEAKADARDNILAVMANGGTPSSRDLKIAGWTKDVAQAMSAISSGSGDSDEVIDLVSKMSTSEIVDMLDTYASDGDDGAVEVIVDDLYLTGRITEEQRADMLKKYRRGSTVTDTTVTTVPTKGNYGSKGGGGVYTNAIK